MLDSCRSPPPGRSGHRGHVEPAGAAAGPAWSPWGCSEPCPLPTEGPWELVPSGVQDEDAPGLGWHRARPDCRPGWAWGSEPGTFPGCLGRLRLCHPRAVVPGAASSSSPGGCSLRGGLGLLHLPWVCRGSGLWLQLHLPLALSQRWHRALQLLWLSTQCWARVWRATVSCRQHCEPGQGQVAAEGADQWCCVMPRVLCQEPAVPCSAQVHWGSVAPCNAQVPRRTQGAVPQHRQPL